MPRPATGSILERLGKDGRINRTLRFPVNGKRREVALGPMSRENAERELAFVMADVARGTWKPARPEPVVPIAEDMPTFAKYVNQWWTLNKGQWSPNTRADYLWRLERHLLPFFGNDRLDQITGNRVKEYIAYKLAQSEAIRTAAAKGKPLTFSVVEKGRTLKRRRRPLKARSINMTVTLLGAIMASAIDDDDLGKLITRNPARGRRVKEHAPHRSYLDTAAQITALLNAAGELDREAKRDRRHIKRRAMIATLVYAGPRIGELCNLRERDLDLASGWLSTGSKTDAGYRRIKIRGALRDELLVLRAERPGRKSTSYVFGTRTGARMSESNFRTRVLDAAVKQANKNLEADGLPPLPEKITPHSLRRTFCSVLYALGEDPGVVMDEMGHTDPALALRVYRQAMRRGEDEKAALRALVHGHDQTTEAAAIMARDPRV